MKPLALNFTPLFSFLALIVLGPELQREKRLKMFLLNLVGYIFPPFQPSHLQLHLKLGPMLFQCS